MWQRVIENAQQSWQASLNGDGCGAMDGQDYSPSLQHPWLAGVPFFAPEAWAPTYDYPLICYLHDDGRSEQDLWNWFPAISDQNYLGLGVRAPFPAQSHMPGQYRWRGQRPDATSAVLQEAVESIQQDWNVHPDRIILMGEGNGAFTALQQFLLNQIHNEPGELKFSGVICRNLPLWWARDLPPVTEFAEGRILLLDPLSERDSEIPAAIDCLSESGIAVTVAAESSQSPASAINHWIMSGISTGVH